MLNEKHYQVLSAESGISDEVIRARGYRSITADAELRELGFAPAQCRAPGLLLPLWTTDSSGQWPVDSGQWSVDSGQSPLTTDHQRTPVRPLPTLFVYRPDTPRVYEDKRRAKLPDGTYPQRVIKYEMPKGEGARLDCPPVCRPLLADPAVPLFITEGQKKADALASRGACAVALLGVWNFKGRNDFGGTTLLADFDYIAFGNRPVYLVFDSDVMSKGGVRAALERLTEHLKRKGAVVHVVYLPAVVGEGKGEGEKGGKGEGESTPSPLHPRSPAPLLKMGVDDWLAATGKGINDLMALAEGPRPEPKAAPPEVELLDDSPFRMAQPLAFIDGRAWVATWGEVRVTESETVNRKGEVVRFERPRVTREQRLFIVRDDGVIFGDGGDRPAGDLDIEPVLPEVLPREARLSIPALKAYREGYRPDPAGVFGRVCACIDRFIDFDRSLADQRTMVEMVACYTMATWFLPAFTVAGFLWPNGDRGSGKTQLLSVVAQMAYLGRVVLGGGSFAALRDLADYGATLAFDDAENFSDPRKTDPDKRALLLAGNRKGNTVPLKERVVDGWQTRYVNTFSFRLFSATQLPDPILASRTIVVPLIRSIDRGRTNVSSEDPAVWPHDRQKLIDDLWLLALAHMAELRECEATVAAASSLSGRNLEPWRALLAVAAWLSGDTKYGIRDTSEEGGSLDTKYEIRDTSEEDGSELVSRISNLVSRMMALSVAYQEERPNVEADDVMGLVIRALGMIVGKLVRDGGDRGDRGDRGDLTRARHFLLTATITQASQSLAELLELDINFDDITSRKIGAALRKMRLPPARQPKTGKKGWVVSLYDVIRWASSYQLDIANITGLPIGTQNNEVTPVTSVTPVTPANGPTPQRGIL